MLIVSRRKIALGTPLSVLLMDNLVLQIRQPCLMEGPGATLSHAGRKAGAAPTALSTGRNLISASVETVL